MKKSRKAENVPRSRSDVDMDAAAEATRLHQSASSSASSLSTRWEPLLEHKLGGDLGSPWPSGGIWDAQGLETSPWAEKKPPGQAPWVEAKRMGWWLQHPAARRAPGLTFVMGNGGENWVKSRGKRCRVGRGGSRVMLLSLSQVAGKPHAPLHAQDGTQVSGPANAAIASTAPVPYRAGGVTVGGTWGGVRGALPSFFSLPTPPGPWPEHKGKRRPGLPPGGSPRRCLRLGAVPLRKGQLPVLGG